VSVTYILHGCVEQWDPSRQAMRMYAPAERLRRHLETRSEPYVDPDDGGDGDVLTVDDSTRGAAQACLMARELGHAVTLFVNPSQIISGRDYWFSRFDALVDARQAATAAFAGSTYDLRTRQGLYDFRWAVRPRLLAADEDSAHRLLDEVAALLQAEQAEVPDFARSIGSDELDELRRAGVRFGNHGWNHQCITSLSAAGQHAHIADTARWLEEATGQSPRDYAVPYGQARLGPQARAAVPGNIYLVGSATQSGVAEDGSIYRRNLTPELQSAQG